MTWVFTKDWPLNIGGKPHFALTGMDADHVRVDRTVCLRRNGTYLLLSLSVGSFREKAPFPPERATDDLFVMAIECTPKTNEGEVSGFLNNAGAIEVNVQQAETGWWLGTYDKDKKMFESK